MQCVSCKQLVPLDGKTSLCPRCGADNAAWQELRLTPVTTQWGVYFDNTLPTQLLWIVVLVTAMIMVVAAAITMNDGPFWLIGALLAVVLCTLFYLLTFVLRWRIREYEWLRREQARWRPSILSLIVLCFVVGILLVLLAALLPVRVRSAPEPTPEPTATALPTPYPSSTPIPLPPPTCVPDPTAREDGKGSLPISPVEIARAAAGTLIGRPALALLSQRQQQQEPETAEETVWDPARRLAPVLLGIALGLFGLGFALASDLVFAQWLNQQLPRPIFADRARMARVLRREAEITFRAGHKDRNWGTRRWYSRYDAEEEQLVVTEEENRSFSRSVPPERISAGIWEPFDGQENIAVEHTNSAVREAEDGWRIWENRPNIEVQIQQMWRTESGGARVRLAVIDRDAEKAMKQDKEIVQLRLQGLSHYELLADEWGWPIDLRDIDDYRLVQLMRRDVSIIEPPEMLKLPQLEETR